MSGEVRNERDGAIARVVFDHAKRRNAITVDMGEAIPRVTEELQRDENEQPAEGVGSEVDPGTDVPARASAQRCRSVDREL